MALIKSIQQVSISGVGFSGTSLTATISAVTVANAIIVYQGQTNTDGTNTDYQHIYTRVELTNSTTVTGFVNSTGGGQSAIVNATVIEFNSGVNSVQAGTISLTSAQTSNTATITAVGANAFVLWLGSTVADATARITGAQSSVDLTNSTTVTAHQGSAFSAMTVGYMVVDLDTTIVSAAAKYTLTDASGSTSYTKTITSAATTGSIVLFNGSTYASNAAASTSAVHTLQLTNATTVTATRVGTDTGSRTIYFTVLTFANGALNQNIQRGVIAQSAATSGTATITSVSTAEAFVNWCWFNNTSGTPNALLPTVTLTNSTTVTAATNAASSSSTSWEVAEFATSPPPVAAYLWAGSAM